MLPINAKAKPEARFIHSAALVVTDILTLEQGAVYAGCTPSKLISALDDSDVAQAVDAEVTRLRYSGDLANIKAARLTDSMLDKLLATPSEEISTSLAMKLTELGIKFREKAAPEQKTQPSNMHVHILEGDDPDPPKYADGNYTLVIDLRDKNPTHTIEHEGITDAE